jgi:formylglycine-generating enzyme required for sulfatase activity
MLLSICHTAINTASSFQLKLQPILYRIETSDRPAGMKSSPARRAPIIFYCVIGLGPLITAEASAADIGDMASIPAGPFIMGSDGGPADERPAHRVEVAAFAIDRLPVTNAKFAEFLNAVGPVNSASEKLFDVDDSDARVHQREGKWAADKGYENHPVVEVSWAGARDYCALAKKRLPTEAEWEKAARGTDGRKYPWGDERPDATRARFDAGYNNTAPVENFSKGVRPYGVFDMSGNAWEWVSSAYLPYPYSPSDGRENPTAGPERVTRGGGHDSTAAELTVTHRGKGLSRNFRSGHHNIGFRCAG